MEKEIKDGFTRRDIVKGGLALGTAAMIPSALVKAAAKPAAKIDNVIGIQVVQYRSSMKV